MNRISRLPRWCHQLYAFIFRYFWFPCPVCDRYFGGHEWRTMDVLTVNGEELAICPACGKDRATA